MYFFYAEPSYLKYYMKMKRKGVNACKLRLSPNEEAFILKEDYERRRKLRLLQVRCIWNIVSTSLCPQNY